MTENTETPEGQAKPENPGDSDKVTVSAQFKEEALKWKGKAEDYNRLKEERDVLEAKSRELERLAYSGKAATDPAEERIARLREQAPFDPVAAATLDLMAENAINRAELWLSNELQNVPPAKRNQVAMLVRNAQYQMNGQDALKLVTDPDTKTLEQQLSDAKAEIDRMKGSKQNGVSPGATIPSPVDTGSDSIKRSDYLAILRAGGDKAVALMKSVDVGKVKMVND